MYTAICTFVDRADAERARDRLVAAGFSRGDVRLEHLESREAWSHEDDLRARGGVEHEIALDPHIVERVTGFLAHLFGADHPSRMAYDTHVDSGRTVVVVDSADRSGADRARAVLEEHEGEHLDVVERPDRRPVREITPPEAADR